MACRKARRRAKSARCTRSFSCWTNRRPTTCRRSRVCCEKRWRNDTGGAPLPALGSRSSGRCSSVAVNEGEFSSPACGGGSGCGLLQLSRCSPSRLDLGGSHVFLAWRDGGRCVSHGLLGTELRFSGRSACRRRWLLCRG